MLVPTSLFVLVTSSIGAFQVFTPVYMMTKGGPLRATDVVGYHIYTEAWRLFRMGRASAQSYILFLVILVVTIIQFKAMNRRMEDASNV
jgi:ABC-type sugar transport system permease subunit